jgi:hypothetical protein
VQELVQGLGLNPANQTLINRLSDRASIPATAQDSVTRAIAAGILVNYPDKAVFNPQQTATRADLTSMVYQALGQAKRVAPINSAYILR